MYFQFHKGTIKTLFYLAHYKSSLNFNSIKVRLKPPIVIIVVFYNYNFNSIKVRLKPVLIVNNALQRKFQFHKGTIKTDGEKTEVTVYV